MPAHAITIVPNPPGVHAYAPVRTHARMSEEGTQRSRAGAYIRKEMLQERWKRQKDTRLNGQHEEAPAGQT